MMLHNSERNSTGSVAIAGRSLIDITVPTSMLCTCMMCRHDGQIKRHDDQGSPLSPGWLHLQRACEADTIRLRSRDISISRSRCCPWYHLEISAAASTPRPKIRVVRTCTTAAATYACVMMHDFPDLQNLLHRLPASSRFCWTGCLLSYIIVPAAAFSKPRSSACVTILLYLSELCQFGPAQISNVFDR